VALAFDRPIYRALVAGVPLTDQEGQWHCLEACVGAGVALPAALEPATTATRAAGLRLSVTVCSELTFYATMLRVCPRSLLAAGSSSQCPPLTGHLTLPSSHCPPLTALLTFPSSHCLPHTALLALLSLHCRPHTALLTPPSSHCPPHTAYLTLPSSHCPPHTAFLTLPSSQCPPLTAFLTLPSSHCLPHSALLSLPSSHCLTVSAHNVAPSYTNASDSPPTTPRACFGPTYEGGGAEETVGQEKTKRDRERSYKESRRKCKASSSACQGNRELMLVGIPTL
jgi:hypothetical protein